MKRALSVLLGAAALLLSSAAVADRVLCQVTYYDTIQLIEAVPVDSPYAVEPQAIGSYFLFRLVVEGKPADLAVIKVYVYADHESGATLIHQANYSYPATNAATHGFSGLNFVYEPVRDGELQYWCEQK